MGVRRILPPAKHSRKAERPRTRTLTAVRACGSLGWLDGLGWPRVWLARASGGGRARLAAAPGLAGSRCGGRGGRAARSDPADSPPIDSIDSELTNKKMHQAHLDDLAPPLRADRLPAD